MELTEGTPPTPTVVVEGSNGLRISNGTITQSFLEKQKRNDVKEILLEKCALENDLKLKSFFPSLLTVSLNQEDSSNGTNISLSVFEGIPIVDLLLNQTGSDTLVFPKEEIRKFKALIVVNMNTKDMASLSKLTKSLMMKKVQNPSVSLEGLSKECKAVSISLSPNIQEINFSNADHTEDLCIFGNDNLKLFHHFNGTALPLLRGLYVDAHSFNVVQMPFPNIDSLLLMQNADFNGEISGKFPNLKKLAYSGSMGILTKICKDCSKLKNFALCDSVLLGATHNITDQDVLNFLETSNRAPNLGLSFSIRITGAFDSYSKTFEHVQKLMLQCEDETSFSGGTVKSILKILPQLKKLMIKGYLSHKVFTVATEFPNIKVFDFCESQNKVLTEDLIKGINNSQIQLLTVLTGFVTCFGDTTDNMAIDYVKLLDHCTRIEGIAFDCEDSPYFLDDDHDDVRNQKLKEALKRNFFVKVDTLQQPHPLHPMKKSEEKILFKKVKPRFFSKMFNVFEHTSIFCEV